MDTVERNVKDMSSPDAGRREFRELFAEFMNRLADLDLDRKTGLVSAPRSTYSTCNGIHHRSRMQHSAPGKEALS